MDLKKLLKEKNLTSRQLSDLCQIPYSTVNDIINGKRNLAKCTAESVETSKTAGSFDGGIAYTGRKKNQF